MVTWVPKLGKYLACKWAHPCSNPAGPKAKMPLVRSGESVSPNPHVMYMENYKHGWNPRNASLLPFISLLKPQKFTSEYLTGQQCILGMLSVWTRY